MDLGNKEHQNQYQNYQSLFHWLNPIRQYNLLTEIVKYEQQQMSHHFLFGFVW